MAKPGTFGKKPFSIKDQHADAVDASLYGHVTALNATTSASAHTGHAQVGKGFALSPIAQASAEVSTSASFSAAAAASPNAITYPSTSISKVYQHWADGDAAKGTAAEWNNNILSDSKSDYFEGEVVPHVFYYKASNNTPLVNGQTYSFNVTYNYYQANTNAGGFVYMTSPNTDRATGSFAGGDAQLAGFGRLRRWRRQLRRRRRWRRGQQRRQRAGRRRHQRRCGQPAQPADQATQRPDGDLGRHRRQPGHQRHPRSDFGRRYAGAGA